MTRFELATSASRTQRSTRLSHIPRDVHSIMSPSWVNAAGALRSRDFSTADYLYPLAIRLFSCGPWFNWSVCRDI